MSTVDRIDPTRSAAETETILSYVEYFRATILMKLEGLSAEQLATPLAPSTMTLGGMLKHLAYVEDWWFSCVFAGHDEAAPFDTAPWDEDDDWEWHSAASDSPEELHAIWHRIVDTSRSIVATAMDSGDGFDQTAVRKGRDGGDISLRWILVHMIEEYGRHAGHADLIRESLDGQVGE